MTATHFVTVPFPGVQRWLESGAAEGLWGVTVWDEKTGDMKLPKAESYGLGAWHPSYHDLTDQFGRAGQTYGIAWSSSPFESDTSRTRGELGALMGLTDPKYLEHRPSWWACLNPSLARVLPNSVHLPAPIHLDLHEGASDADWLGLFVPATEKKAIFAQLLAVKFFQDTHPHVELHTNLESYERVMAWLGLKYVTHPWMPRSEYQRVLSKCRVVLHASLAESFGYGAVDALMSGAIVVGSPALEWLPEPWKVANANDPLDILRVLSNLWEKRELWDPHGFVRGVAERQNLAAREAVALIQRGKP